MEMSVMITRAVQVNNYQIEALCRSIAFQDFFPSHKQTVDRSGRLSLALMRVEVTYSTSHNELVIHPRGMVGKFAQSIAEHALVRTLYYSTPAARPLQRGAWA
jgi:hypothetical protein